MNWWEKISGSSLAQGDLLEDCLIPIYSTDPSSNLGAEVEIGLVQSRLIIVTQSCDLENNKVEFVALCPIHTIDEFERSPSSKKPQLESIRRGHVAALHLVASTGDPTDNRKSFVIDFGQIISLPLAHLSNHAIRLGDRWRLKSPYLEHFSQAFARFFMRVGLPSQIPPFR